MQGFLIILTLLSTIGVMFVFSFWGIRRSNRARTLEEFLIYNKEVRPPQYTTTMVAYALQLVVTVYFIYWGFRYGLGVLYYLIFWWLGIFCFELLSPKLVEFCLGNETLHGYLQFKYGRKWPVRKLAAACTLLGLLGAIIIEVNFATDLIATFTASITGNQVDTSLWIALFLTFIIFALWYMTIGGYKASVITDELQLPISIACLVFVLCFISLLGSYNGFIRESRILLFICFLYILAILFFRQRNINEQNEIAASFSNKKTKHLDRMIWSLYLSGIFIIITFFLTLFIKAPNTKPAELQGAIPLYSLSSLKSQLLSWQDFLVLISFFILDISWQFVDMAAWQRIESLDTTNLSRDDVVKRIKSVIRATKWESPLSWSLGILLGFGLHYSGLFNNINQAEESLQIFVSNIASLNSPYQLINLLSLFLLPFLIIAFISIMLSTVDSCISTITFSAFSDYGGVELKEIKQKDTTQKEKLLRYSQLVTFSIVIAGAIAFLIANFIFKLSPFLIINLAYASQLSLLPSVLYILLVKNTNKTKYHSGIAFWSIIGGLFGTFIIGIALSNSKLSDLAYTIPNITCVFMAVTVFLIGLIITRRVKGNK